MTNYSDIEIQTAENLLKRGFKWIARSIYGAIIAYKIMSFPVLHDSNMYKGMELDHAYSLEELGL